MASFSFNLSSRSFEILPGGESSVVGEGVELQDLAWWYGLPVTGRERVLTPHDPSMRIQDFLIDKVAFVGKSVLHIGCRDGFFMFLAEALGAREVKGVDDAPRSMRLSASYAEAKRLLGSSAERIDIDIEQIGPQTTGMFDIVLLYDVLSRSECPARVLAAACSVCREELLLVTHFVPGEGSIPSTVLYPTYSGDADFRDKCGPNLAWISTALKANGFDVHFGRQWDDTNTAAVQVRRILRSAPSLGAELPELSLDEGMERETALLVMSCERYQQAWGPFFTLFFRYWPECPYEVYLCTDRGSYPDPRVTMLEIGKDLGWANNVRHALTSITASRVILTLEDFFPNFRWDDALIRKLVRHAHDYDVGCLRFFPCPGPTGPWFGTPILGTIGPTDPYRVSTMNAVWKKQMLFDLIQDGMNAWQFELEGSKASSVRPEPFLSVFPIEGKQCPMPYYATGITKGVWEEAALALLRREGIATEGIRRRL